MKPLLLALFALTSVFVVAGCGQSGPLYLPGDPSTIQTQPQPQPEETQQDEEEDNNNNDDT